jgi:hypothetical protein
VNELVGLFIGKFHLKGLSLFRAVHHTHHAHLGTERDEQLWPFVDPKAPRWGRRIAAACELSAAAARPSRRSSAGEGTGS